MELIDQTNAILYWLLCLVSCGYVAYAGKKEGLLVSVFILVASLLTFLVYELDQWTTTNLIVLSIDISLLIGLLIIAIQSDKNWLLWICSFQLIGTMTHISADIVSSVAPRVYQLVNGFWSIPLILTMVLGVFTSKAFNDDGHDLKPPKAP